MTPEQFLTFARVLPEALLMVSSSGEILAINRPASVFFGKPSKELIHCSLHDLANTPTEDINRYLRSCAQSRRMILGTLAINQSQSEQGQSEQGQSEQGQSEQGQSEQGQSGQKKRKQIQEKQAPSKQIVYRAQGAVIQPRSQENPALIMLRLEKRDNNRFVALNQKIQELSQENQRRQRTQSDLTQSNKALKNALIKLQDALDSIQSEKMSGLSKMVAGIAHEINNPISFIHGNVTYAEQYYADLLDLIDCYQRSYPQPNPSIQEKLDDLDLVFLKQDIQKMLCSMKTGSKRVATIVQSLRTFSRIDESTFKTVDIHEGLEATLMILQNHLKADSSRTQVHVVKDYGKLPPIHCAPGSLNQVFISFLTNAIDALEERRVKNSRQSCLNPSDLKSSDLNSSDKTSNQILGEAESDKETADKATENNESAQLIISTETLVDEQIAIRIKDNGSGISEQIMEQIFDPFFTTKPVGKGTGLGLSISYQIVASHGGQIEVASKLGVGTEFTIKLPLISQPHVS